MTTVERLTGKTLTALLLEANLLEESEGWHLEWSQPRIGWLHVNIPLRKTKWRVCDFMTAIRELAEMVL